MSKPKFQKAHYVALAKVFKANYPGDKGVRNIMWVSIRHELALMLERDNPQFDRQRFYEACEP